MNRKFFFRGVLIGALLGWMVTFAWFWSPGALTFRSAESRDGSYIAQVEMSRRFPFLVINADLTVRRVADGQLVLKELLTARDRYSEGPDQIHSLRWTAARTVTVEMDSPNFKGHRDFMIKE